MSENDQMMKGGFERVATLVPRPLIDPFARAITYLRVSVTDRCDFRCVYCMAEDMNFLPKNEISRSKSSTDCALPSSPRVCASCVSLEGSR